MESFLSRHCYALILVFFLLQVGINSSFGQGDCLPTIEVSFSPDGTIADVQSDKELSNVVLKFCDGSPDYKFDNLSGYQDTFSYQDKELAGVWVKSGCNQSDDGPGYGEFFGRVCDDPPPVPTATPTANPTSTATPLPTATPTPQPTATPSVVTICHIPDGRTQDAVTIQVPLEELNEHLSHGDLLGECPIDCKGAVLGDATLDQCGICGGDNSTCTDCNGEPNGGAVIDCCGVCGGDGTSCYDECGRCYLPRLRSALDKVKANLVSAIRRYSDRQLLCSKASKRAVTLRLQKASILAREIGTLIQGLIPPKTRQCIPEFCVSSEQSPTRIALNEKLKELYLLAQEARQECHRARNPRCSGGRW